MNKVISYQVADSIDIRAAKAAFRAELIYGDSDELFYQPAAGQYMYVFKYGVASFYNASSVQISELLRFLQPFCKNPYNPALTDEFLIDTGQPEDKMGYNKIELTSADAQTLRVIMLNVSESVALDYYLEQTTQLMHETNQHTQKLEQKGRLSISGTKLKQFIGRTLLLKNRIAENLYIFGAPEETWEDQRLNKLHNELRKNFEIEDRFLHTSEGLAIVKENLELFKDMLQYRNSVFLEWIIIILIAIEVVHFLADEIF
jgi:required for meiotic nuclear division protein 1